MKLGVILGDQLSLELATLRSLNPQSDLIMVAEVPVEAGYVKHHKQKIALIFSAMRHFAEELREAGWQVVYFAYGQHPHQSLLDALSTTCQQHTIDEVVITQCGEYRLQHEIDSRWCDALNLPLTCLQDDRFICPLDWFRDWADGRKQLRMEYFYREMRRRTGLLMDGDQPAGGKWNYDASNRSAYDAKTPIPEPLNFDRDAIDQEVLTLVAEQFSDHPGSVTRFLWGTRRSQAQAALGQFIQHRLVNFGDYQDAMVSGEDTLFHSLLSPYLNIGLLDPLQVCQAAERAYLDGRAPLNAVEGFIRQIIGWREYVRGIYWLHMPDYAALNKLGNQRDLPPYYWNGKTKMHCMAECFRNTFDNAYAHHIQRLMVTGNFALLAGIEPEQICDWYLAVYADAFDWVELPNTLGMVMHADGGYLGSKPYAASGKYIHKMSDYCQHCHYNVKTAEQEDSCPFNAMYWHFLYRHRQAFENNPRMAMVYKSFARMSEAKQDAILRRGEHLLENIACL